MNELGRLNFNLAMAIRRPSPPTGAVGFIERFAEQRILEAQRKGEFDDLAGKGKPLELAEHERPCRKIYAWPTMCLKTPTSCRPKPN